MSDAKHIPRYICDKGDTEGNNPERWIWYGVCGYWTDDFNKLPVAMGRIPTCPTCHTVGFQCEASDWEMGAEEFDRTNPDYKTFLNDNKEKCFSGIGCMQAYRKWRHNKKHLSPPNPN